MLSSNSKGSVVLQPVIVSLDTIRSEIDAFCLLGLRVVGCYNLKSLSWTLKSIDAAPQGFMYRNAETLFPTNL